MATQTKMYRIEYRRTGQEFQELIGTATESRVQVDEIARAYAEDHPDLIVAVFSEDDMEIQYKVNGASGRMDWSIGNGWMFYAG